MGFFLTMQAEAVLTHNLRTDPGHKKMEIQIHSKSFLHHTIQA